MVTKKQHNNKAKKRDRFYSQDFESFKSNVKHHLRAVGDIDFMLQLVEENTVFDYFSSGREKEALYLLSAIDYLCRVNDLPLIAEYETIRSGAMDRLIWPRDVILLSIINEDDEAKEQAVAHAIPEFLSHNLVEGDLRDAW